MRMRPDGEEDGSKEEREIRATSPERERAEWRAETTWGMEEVGAEEENP